MVSPDFKYAVMVCEIRSNKRYSVCNFQDEGGVLDGLVDYVMFWEPSANGYKDRIRIREGEGWSERLK